MKKILLTLAVLVTALATQVSAEYNKYNEMDAINIYNGTLQDVADTNQVTVDELKVSLGLPEDMPADTNEAIAIGLIPMGKMAENNGVAFSDMLKQIAPQYKGETEITAQTPCHEVENFISLKDYYAGVDINELIAQLGLPEDVTEDTLYGDVRIQLERKLLEMTSQLQYMKDDAILVMLKGRYVDFDVAPIIMNDRVMVPMRNIFEALGANVNWMGETQTIFTVKGADIITMQVGQCSFFKNEDKVEIDTPSVIVDGRTLVPISAVAEALDTQVFYNQNTRTVVIH